MGEGLTAYIYKSSSKEELYLFVLEQDDFSEVPEELLKGFGTAQFVMPIELTEGRPLARSSATEVIAKLQEQGFYLQLPPADPALSVEAALGRLKI